LSERRFALIIANDQYDDDSLSELQAPKLDANALANVLGDPESCNFLVQILVNRRAHRVNQVIESFFDGRNRDDLLLLYFSGHGVKDEDGKLYFATPDTRRNRLRSTAVSAAFINDLMRRTRARTQVLLLDCCFSGAFAKGMIAKSGTAIGSSIGTNDYFQGRGRVVLTASDAMQYAFEEDELVEAGVVNSIFTSAIVDGIESWKADRDRDDRISITELYDYVDSYVHERTPNQRPSMWSFETQGEIIIAEREYIPEVEEEEVLEYVPEAVSEVVSEETPEVVPEDVPEEVPEVVSEVVLDVEPEVVSEEVVPEVVPEEAPEAVPEATPEAAPEVVPEVVPEEVPEVIPEIVPEAVPEVAPEAVPEEEPEDEPPKVTEEEPEVISEGTPPEKKPPVSAEPSAQPQRSFPLMPAIAVLVIIGGIIGVAYMQGMFSPRTTDISIDDFSATPSVITRGESFSLRWSVSGATAVTIDQGIGRMALSGDTSVSPDETTTYTLTATNEDRSAEATVQVVVEAPGVPIVEYFTTDGSSLSWSVSGASSVRIDNGIGSVALSGSTSVSPGETTTYTLSASNEGVYRYASVQVVVAPIDPPVIEYFTAEGSTLSWSVSDATRVIINQGIGLVDSTGTYSVSPTVDTTYKLTATNQGGDVIEQVTVSVQYEGEPVLTEIQIGITGSYSGGLENTRILVEEILEPDLAEYLDLIGSDVTIDFIIKDNQGTAAIALENTQSYKAMGIDLIVGHGWSSQCQASLPYVNENNMLLFSASSTSPLLAIEDDRLFRACPNDLVQGPILAEMWDTWGVDAVLTIQRADAWGDGLWNVLEQEFSQHGIENLGRMRYPGEVTEFSSYLDQANDIITDAISVYGADNVGIQFYSFSEIRMIQDQASDYPNLINVIWMTTESGGRSQQTLDEVGEWATQTRHFSALMRSDETNPRYIAFEEKYDELIGYGPSFYAAAQYDACRLLVECILQTDSTDATDIAEVLIPMSQEYYGLSGWMALDENGDRQPAMYDIWGYYEDPDTAGEYLFMKFGSYDGQSGTLSWDDDALENYAGIIRPGA